jgi:hypothetical protein
VNRPGGFAIQQITVIAVIAVIGRWRNGGEEFFNNKFPLEAAIMYPRKINQRALVIGFMSMMACSSSKNLVGNGAGGTTTTPGTGGFSAGGGLGGTAATGGATGGMITNGGAPALGGMLSEGGILAMGGTLSVGGEFATGGTLSTTGGELATGGVPSTGGIPKSGGVPSTGGIPKSGGVPSTGGIPKSGGMTAAGGTMQMGGMTGTGGSTHADAGASCHSPGTLMVVNNGMTSYGVDQVANPTLTFCRGSTYVFSVNSAGHPFYIKTVRSSGTGNAFDVGVTGNGTTVGDVTFVVPATAPDTLFYDCANHLVMGGTINITN